MISNIFSFFLFFLNIFLIINMIINNKLYEQRCNKILSINLILIKILKYKSIYDYQSKLNHKFVLGNRYQIKTLVRLIYCMHASRIHTC